MGSIRWNNGGWFAAPNLFFDDKIHKSPHAIAVMVVLCRFADQRGIAWPGKKRIAAMAGMSVRKVDAAINELVALDWVAVLGKTKSDGSPDTNDYMLMYPENIYPPAQRAGPVPQDMRDPPAQRAGNSYSVDSDSFNNNDQHVGFEEFWTRYPRKIGKKAALRKYIATIKSVSHSEIMAGVERYIAKIALDKTEAKYIAYPVTWLNQGRWEDEYTSPVTEPKKIRRLCPKCRRPIIGRTCLEPDCGWAFDNEPMDVIIEEVL